MQIDRQALDKLLSLNDRQLSFIINKIATENGIDPSILNINPKDINSIRSALSSATDEDLKKIAEQYSNFNQKGGRASK